MAVTWFQLETNAPNDPKLKAIIRRGGQAWAGATLLLWCYIGSHGRGEPGLGVRADGTPLHIRELASECHFTDADGTPNPEAAERFLDFLAEQEHIHAGLWRDKRIVFLPAMWTRLTNYARTKGRQGSQFDDAEGLASALITGSAVTRKAPKARKAPAGPSRAKKSLQTNKTNKQTDKQTKEKYSSPAEERGTELTLLPTEPTAAKDHPIKAVLEFHDQQFEKKTGQRYPNYTEGDTKNVKLMLRKTSQADLQAEIAFMFQCRDDFVQQCGYTIGAFMKLRPKLISLRAKAGRDPTPGRTAVIPGKYSEFA